ncbi:MAG: TonB-dependent receptor, partial [Pseudohongiellaceae bacterium]
MKKSRFVLLPLALAVHLGVQAQPVEEIVVLGVRDTSTVRTEDTLVAPPDTAQLLRQMPGANINKNGELTGIAQYRGMYGDRVNVSVNGARISSSGPNAMDSPLHYAPVALLESLTIHRGITPVSQGQETIGGSVEAVTFAGDFANSSNFTLNSRLYAGAQSVNEGAVGSGIFTLANDTHLLRASFMEESASDSEFAGGSIRPSAYQRERFDIGYGFHSGAHELRIDFARNNTGDAGTAALPMDILAVDSTLLNSRYEFQGSDFTFTAELSVNDLDHGMTNYHLRRPPQSPDSNPDPMRFRQTFATSDSTGFALQLEQYAGNGLWRYGLDGHFAQHDADIFNPNAALFYVGNFNDAEKQIIGIFVERELSISDNMGLDIGIRYNQVRTDSGTASANLNPMGMTAGMPFMMNNIARMIAGDFNDQTLARKDNNLDWFARLSMDGSGDLIWYAGLARKTRSPSYQERYLWMPLESTGGLADGKTYVGNATLAPEVAHEAELGFDWNGRDLNLYPR